MLVKYRQINESFDKKLVFHLGSRSGFFSEYNNMILCMIHCLQENIQFQLYSRDLSIAVRNGWTDFFEPFCPETFNGLHQLFNCRFPRPTPQFKLRKAFATFTKTLCGCNYLTYELWNQFSRLNSVQSVFIPALDKKNSLRQTCRDLVNITWRFKPEIMDEIQQEIRKLKLPSSYLTVHIRAGDKIKEYKGCPVATYIEKLESVSDLHDVLVMTDDYRIFEQLKANYPSRNFYTLETPEQQGYQHRKNKRKNIAEKRAGTIRFFAGIELAANAKHFVGTYSSNIGAYLGMRMSPEQCHAVDFDQWRI